LPLTVRDPNARRLKTEADVGELLHWLSPPYGTDNRTGALPTVRHSGRSRSLVRLRSLDPPVLLRRVINMKNVEPANASGKVSSRPSLNAVPQSGPPAPSHSSSAGDIAPRTRTPADAAGRRRSWRALTRPLWIIAICVAVAALRLGRQLLIPVVLAVLLALVLSAIVESLRRYRIPRGFSALVLMLLIGVAVGSVLHSVEAPARQWIESAPRILRIIEHRTRAAQSIVRQLDALAKRASAIAGPGDAPGAALVPAPPASSLSAMDVVESTSGVAAALIMGAALTLLLLAAGPAALARMAAPVATDGRALQVLRVIEAIRVEVGRYYGTLALINLAFGTATALLMWSLGMPNPMLWGALAAVLNFIPYLGCATTFVILTLVAFVSFDGISHALLVGASFLLLAAVEGHIIEPVFVGRRLDLNPVVVLVALWAGAWLWGIAGMVVALPVLVATKVAAARTHGGAPVVRFLSPPHVRPRRVWYSRFSGDRW
jgi:predicted PurR-regulated permease PerM